MRRAPGPTPRDGLLDLARFACALAVVAFHLTWFGPHVEPGLARFGIAGRLSQYGFLGVEVFFLISGYVILATLLRRPGASFLRARVARLLPAWVAVVGLLGVVLVVERGADAGLLGRIGANLTMLHWTVGVADLDGSYWTLAVELRFYVLAFLAAALVGAHRVVGAAVAWLALAVVAQVVSLPPTVVTWLDLSWAPLFVGGIAFADLRWRGWRWWHGPLLAASLLASVATVLDHGRVVAFVSPLDPDPRVLVAAVVAGFALLAVAALGPARRLDARWVLVLGATSYPLYLVHQELGYLVLARLDPLPAPVALAAVVAGLLAVAWAVQAWVEPPLQRWILRVGTTRSDTVPAHGRTTAPGRGAVHRRDTGSGHRPARRTATLRPATFGASMPAPRGTRPRRSKATSRRGRREVRPAGAARPLLDRSGLTPPRAGAGRRPPAPSRRTGRPAG